MNNIVPILKRYGRQFGRAQALGFVGIQSMQLKADLHHKYANADMSKWATGHSYMHIPSADVIKYGYETHIINKYRGVNGFGTYSKSAFPDYPVPSPVIQRNDNEQGKVL